MCVHQCNFIEKDFMPLPSEKSDILWCDCGKFRGFSYSCEGIPDCGNNDHTIKLLKIIKTKSLITSNTKVNIILITSSTHNPPKRYEGIKGTYKDFLNEIKLNDLWYRRHITKIEELKSKVPICIEDKTTIKFILRKRYNVEYYYH